MDLQQTIYPLVYISAANKEFSELELALLLVKARANNDALDVIGMLLYHDGSFNQALEGPKAAVEQLDNVIGKDPRHVETRVLYRGELAQREFESWSMGFYRSTESEKENLEGFHRFLKAGFRRRVNDEAGSARKALLAFREGKWHQRDQVA
ncbi:MAG: hypothetical protein ACI9DC_001985 [Gammaproteobacteria bacterium]|jgi:hypothetical protein